MAALRTGTHVFTARDGERMVYYTLGDRSWPTVLLLHGCETRAQLQCPLPHTRSFLRPATDWRRLRRSATQPPR
jgi:hypothetical protein